MVSRSMFLLIPLGLILISCIGIFLIVWRKMPYLKKLTPEVGANGNVFTDFAPEFFSVLGSVKVQEYKNLWFLELEKFLRRLRVVSLRMDRISDSWIKRIRRGNAFRMITSLEDKTAENKEPSNVQVPVVKTEIRPSVDEMKREEQRLIIEIAKNPKDAKLYEALGDLYVKMGNLPDAKESFEAAIELNPNNDVLVKKHSQVLEKVVY